MAIDGVVHWPGRGPPWLRARGAGGHQAGDLHVAFGGMLVAHGGVAGDVAGSAYHLGERGAGLR